MKQYTILNATGGLGGSTFGSVVNTNLPSGFKSSLSYDANNAYLNLALNFTAPPGGALNGNQQDVGNALVNFFNRTGGIPLVFGALTPAGLTQISGETAAGSQQTTFDAMTQFMGVMTDPFIGGPRRFDAGAGATPFAEEGCRTSLDASPDRSRSPSERDAYAAIYRKAPIRDAYDPRWSVWAAGFGGSQTTDGNAAARIEHHHQPRLRRRGRRRLPLSPHTVAGFALAGGGTNFSVANGGTGRSDLFQAGAFIRHTVGRGLHHRRARLWLAGRHHRSHRDGRRHRPAARAASTPTRSRAASKAAIASSTPWMGGAGITPYAAGAVHHLRPAGLCRKRGRPAPTPSRSPTARKSVTATRSELGLRTDKSFAMHDAMLTLRGRAAWAHDFNHRSHHRRDLPDAARRDLRRQRRSAGARQPRWSPRRPR